MNANINRVFCPSSEKLVPKRILRKNFITYTSKLCATLGIASTFIYLFSCKIIVMAILVNCHISPIDGYALLHEDLYIVKYIYIYIMLLQLCLNVVEATHI